MWRKSHLVATCKLSQVSCCRLTEREDRPERWRHQRFYVILSTAASSASAFFGNKSLDVHCCWSQMHSVTKRVATSSLVAYARSPNFKKESDVSNSHAVSFIQTDANPPGLSLQLWNVFVYFIVLWRYQCFRVRYICSLRGEIQFILWH